VTVHALAWQAVDLMGARVASDAHYAASYLRGLSCWVAPGVECRWVGGGALG
jgi:hypothetical protein